MQKKEKGWKTLENSKVRRKTPAKLKRKIIKAFPVRFSGTSPSLRVSIAYIYIKFTMRVREMYGFSSWESGEKKRVLRVSRNAPEWLSNLEIHAQNWIFLGFNENISHSHRQVKIFSIHVKNVVFPFFVCTVFPFSGNWKAAISLVFRMADLYYPFVLIIRYWIGVLILYTFLCLRPG